MARCYRINDPLLVIAAEVTVLGAHPLEEFWRREMRSPILYEMTLIGHN